MPGDLRQPMATWGAFLANQTSDFSRRSSAACSQLADRADELVIDYRHGFCRLVGWDGMGWAW